MKLYKSEHFALTEIRTTGKKHTNGILCFKGLPSVYGSANAVCAIEDGTVLFAGNSNNIKSRTHRLGTMVMISGREGVTVTYGRLSRRIVSTGDYVKRGELIGFEGSSGSGSENYLLLEFRRNGRRVDGCEYLGLDARTAVFKPEDLPLSEVESRTCGLTTRMRIYMESCPEADVMWKLIFNKLARYD